MKKLLWKSIALPDHVFYLARCTYPPMKRFAPHMHDFAEIMLIESGAGRQVLNGFTFTLNSGDLFLIRPADRHSIEAGRQGLRLSNLAFPIEHATSLEARYLPANFCYFRSDGKFPWTAQLSAEAFARIVALFTGLSGTTRNRFELERGLMNLFAILQNPAGDLPLGHAPDWLNHACAEMHRPAYLAEGVSALVRFSGRSAEHTARELRRYSGYTPTEFVNRLRIDHAAQLLCTTGKSVLDIALECGFEHQGHFHNCFKTRFQTTPLKYRKQNRAPVL
jgi:AraC family cel operon transcriptional repressor